MGLLDWAQTPQGIGLLSAAAGAMAGARRGRPWNTAGIGLSTGIGGYQQAIDMQRQEAERKRQEMQQEQTKNALMNAYKAGIVKRKTETPAQYNAGGKTFGTMQEAEQYARAFDPRQELGAALYGEFGGKEPLANNIDFSQYAGAPFVAPDLNPMMGIDTVPGTVQEVDEYDPRKAAMAMLESGNVDAMNAGFRLLSEVPKGQEFGTTPFIGKDGKAYLIGKNGAIMETGLLGPEKDIDYNKPFLPDGTPNAAYQAWKLSDSKAGAANVANRIENKVGDSIAGQVGPMLKDSKERTTGAINLANSSRMMVDALDRGSAYVGPMANARLKMAQIGQMLGVGGKNEAEKINNTRQLIRGLAEGAVEARKELAGQGQVTESEAAAVQKAYSGNIEDLTANEIRLIAGLNIKRERLARQRHQQMMKAAPGQLQPFYQVDEEAPTNSNGGWSIKRK